ncbi:MAG: L,D-transpeptidase family protein [Hydrogenothermaceae bacterium]|nr:L,D-transpeptidase family protein [Hydrogenothermaceae bacterium]
MFRIFLTFIFTVSMSAYSSEIVKFEEDPLEIAIKEVSAKKFQNDILKAIKYYNDGLFSKSIDISKDLLKTSGISDKDRQIIYLLLSSSFYKTKDEDSMIGLIKSLESKSFPDKYMLYRVFQLASLLFTERKNEEGIKAVFDKIYVKRISIPDLDFLLDEITKNDIFNIYPNKTQTVNYRGVEFQLNRNIFPFDPSKRVFGELFIYIVENDTTLLEISKKFDFGYYELKNANPLIDPFDVRKNQIVIFPYRRIFPYEKINYNNIYINLVEKRLYYPVVIDNKSYVITFPIGIGTDEAQSPVGEFKISEKRKDPAWYPPESIRKEQPDLPKVFPPGPDNPLGTRAMRLGNTSFLMHGTNKEYGIGMKVSHGCIRMYNEDVEKLFEVVDVGTKVVSNEIYIKKAGNEIEIFDESGYKFLDTVSTSKVFNSIYKTDMFGKSFSIKIF